MAVTTIDYERHVKYFKMCLKVLPSAVQSEGSNMLMLIYCAIGGLCLLNYDFTDDEKQRYTEHVYAQLVSTGEGFRGSHILKLQHESGYDQPTIANTYSALCILLMLEDDYSARLDSDKIMGFVNRCQTENGSFKSLLDKHGNPFGDGDLRQTYMALSIRKLLNYKGTNDIDLSKIKRNILSKKVLDGGLGNGESHAGLTFCGLAALKLMGELHLEDWTRTVNWLVHRQISFNDYNMETLSQNDATDESDNGGHNGRVNKLADTCYSFWCSGSLSMLNAAQFVNSQEMQTYLLVQTQNNIMGGFSKTDVDHPDPYHSFLGLCALSLVGDNDLARLNPCLVITQKAYNRLK